MKIVCIRPISYNFNGVKIRKPAGVELEISNSIGEFLVARGDAQEIAPKKAEKPRAEKQKKVEQIEQVIEESVIQPEYEVSEDAISSEFE